MPLTAIDLSKLPPPRAVELQDYEATLQAMLDDFSARYPDFDVPKASDPAYKILEVAAYQLMLQSQVFNERALQNLLAFATGSDLEHIGSMLGVTRQLVREEDLTSIPPVPPEYEDDERLRYRIQLSLEGFTSAGSTGAYEFHALKVSPRIKDVSVTSPSPGVVAVYPLTREGKGLADEALIEQIQQALSDDSVRPLTDKVEVKAPTVHDYHIDMRITLYPGPDHALVLHDIRKRLAEFAMAHHRMGHDITLSGLYSAAHIEGVQNVDILTPSTTLVAAPFETYFCSDIQVSFVGVDI
tara:strand:+ start:69 stop:962 length:894 start_codon:yes stop_codon:yes gene_type:complete